jgi:hypothetical protein
MSKPFGVQAEDQDVVDPGPLRPEHFDAVMALLEQQNGGRLPPQFIMSPALLRECLRVFPSAFTPDVDVDDRRHRRSP